MTSPASARTKSPPHNKMKLHELFDKAEGKGNVDAVWTQMKAIIHSAAAKTIGSTKRKKNPWISTETLQLIEKRARARKGSTKTFLRREVKKSVRKVHSIVKQLSSKPSGLSENSKDSQGQLVTDANERIETWATHFEQLLNRPEPVETHIEHD